MAKKAGTPTVKPNAWFHSDSLTCRSNTQQPLYTESTGAVRSLFQPAGVDDLGRE